MDPVVDTTVPTADKPRDGAGRFTVPTTITFDTPPPTDAVDPFLSSAGQEERSLLAGMAVPPVTPADASEAQGSHGADAESEVPAAATPATEADAPEAESVAEPATEALEPENEVERMIARVAVRDPKRAARLLAVLADEEPAASAAPVAPVLDDKALIDVWNQHVAKGGDFAGVKAVAKAMVDQEMAPIRRDNEARSAAEATRIEAGQKFAAFAKANPGWEKHQKGMVAEANRLAADLKVDVMTIPLETAYRNAQAAALMGAATAAATKVVKDKKSVAARGTAGVPSSAPAGPVAKKTPSPDEAMLAATYGRFQIESIRRNPF